MANKAAFFRPAASVVIGMFLLAASCLAAMPLHAGEVLILGKSEASLSSDISGAVLREA